MKKSIIFTAIAFTFLIIYFMIIISITDNKIYEYKEQVEISQTNGLNEKIGVSDSVEVSIIRNRWYGKIYEESSGENLVSKVKLFNLLTLPLKKSNIDFVNFHIIAGSLALLLIIFGLGWDVIDYLNDKGVL